MPATSAKRSSGSGKVTVDHNEIRRWVEQRGGHPACVKGTQRGDSCLLRIDFPGYSGEGKLEPIEWDEFFQTFDENKLAFVYQDSKNGQPSRFSKLVSRDSAKMRGSASSGNQRGGSRRGQNQSGARSGGERTSGKSTGNRRGSARRSRASSSNRARATTSSTRGRASSSRRGATTARRRSASSR
jgi:hypothetical protein